MLGSIRRKPWFIYHLLNKQIKWTIAIRFGKNLRVEPLNCAWMIHGIGRSPADGGRLELYNDPKIITMVVTNLSDAVQDVDKRIMERG